MITFDHLRIPVTDLARSRDWYVRTLGLTVEFEVPDRQTVALQDTDRESSSPMVRKSYWGYWAELADPDGYLIRLWDEGSMKEQ
jgi:Glyoxalase/Bleomycin resistance protein/Dioxygenase superfamily